MNSIIEIKITSEFSGFRLDKAIQLVLTSSEKLRSQLSIQPSVKQIKRLIEDGEVNSSNNLELRASYKVQAGELYFCPLATLLNLSHSNLVDEKLHLGGKLNKQGVKNKTKDYWKIIWDTAQEKLVNIPVSNHHSKPFEVIYADRYFMVVNKSTGLPTSPTIDPKRLTLFHHLLVYISQVRKQSNSDLSMPYLRNLHRLDKDTSGLVLFSRQASVTNSLSALFREGQIDKRYYLVCHRPSSGPLFDFIEAQAMRGQDTGLFTFEAYMQDSRKLKSNSIKQPLATVSQINSRHKSIWTVVDRNGLYSKTDFKVLSLSKKYVCLEAHLHTGRTHQIRVHLQALKAPIVGDPIYGKDDKWAKRLYLHAHHLSFTSEFEENVNQSFEFNSKLPQSFCTDFTELFLSSKA